MNHETMIPDMNVASATASQRAEIIKLNREKAIRRKPDQSSLDATKNITGQPTEKKPSLAEKQKNLSDALLAKDFLEQELRKRQGKNSADT
jgi:hypothetical protein